MKDLSKEERLNQRITELERQIYEKDNAFDKEQGKRVKRTFFILCGVIYLLLFYFALEGDINTSVATASNANTIDIIETIFYAIVALTFGVGFLAGVVMFISYGVLAYIMNGATKRVETIAKLKGELSALKSEKHNNFEDDKIKKLEKHIDYLENYYAHKCDDCTFLKLLKENTEENEQSNEVEEDE